MEEKRRYTLYYMIKNEIKLYPLWDTASPRRLQIYLLKLFTIENTHLHIWSYLDHSTLQISISIAAESETAAVVLAISYSTSRRVRAKKIVTLIKTLNETLLDHWATSRHRDTDDGDYHVTDASRRLRTFPRRRRRGAAVMTTTAYALLKHSDTRARLEDASRAIATPQVFANVCGSVIRTK